MTDLPLRSSLRLPVRNSCVLPFPSAKRPRSVSDGEKLTRKFLKRLERSGKGGCRRIRPRILGQRDGKGSAVLLKEFRMLSVGETP